ncbi:MAG: hypothetical protein ACREJD_00570 [Phycisphaerales bacterium]
MTSLTDELDRDLSKVSESRSRRSYGPIGAAIAIVVAIAGLSTAGWSLYENTRPTPRPKSASDVVRAEQKNNREAPKADSSAPVVAQAGSPGSQTRAKRSRAMVGEQMLPTFIENPQFTPVNNSEDATQAVASLGAAAGERSTKIEGLTATPLQTSDQISAALTRLLGPLAQGEIKDGAGFITANGGKPPASGTIPGIVQQIAALLKFCELDTTNMKVRKAAKPEGSLATILAGLPAGAVPMMINQNRSDDGNETGTLTMPLNGLLDGSLAGIPADAPRVEVTMPAKLKGEQFADKKFLLCIVLAQNAKLNTWVPQTLQFHSNNGETIKALSKMLRPASASVGDGAPPPKAPSDRR